MNTETIIKYFDLKNREYQSPRPPSGGRVYETWECKECKDVLTGISIKGVFIEGELSIEEELENHIWKHRALTK